MAKSVDRVPAATPAPVGSPQETPGPHADRTLVLSRGEGRAAPASPGGDRIVWKATAEDTLGAYALQEVSAPPAGRGVQPHDHHGQDEAFYVLEGEITFEVGTIVVPARTGTFVLAPSGVVHSHRNTGKTFARWLTIRLQQQTASERRDQ
jgi:quercetin dioxygenase-like cupin family protein